MGWGERRVPGPGNAGQVATAHAAFDRLGIAPAPLAIRALLAADEIEARRARRVVGPLDPAAAPLSRVSLLRKEDAACCQSRRDADGRLPLGFCGPNCERRAPRRTAS